MVTPGTPDSERWRRRVVGRSAIGLAVGEAVRGILMRPGQAVILVFSVAAGVALALAIIAASRGVDQRVSLLVEIEPLPPQLQIDEIDRVLDQTRNLLTRLAFGFTAALVGTVTWMSIGRRRREIGIMRQYGLHVWEVLVELWTAATILCLIGGVVGVGAGLLLCRRVEAAIPSLPMEPTQRDVVMVFPVVVILSFGATAVVASYFALFPSGEPEL